MCYIIMISQDEAIRIGYKISEAFSWGIFYRLLIRIIANEISKEKVRKHFLHNEREKLWQKANKIISAYYTSEQAWISMHKQIEV